MADKDKKKYNKQDSPENSNSSGKEKSKKPRFNFYWIYLLIALVFIAINFFPKDFARETNWLEVKKMLSNGEVESFKVINKEFVYVYLNKQAIREKKEEFENNNPFSSVQEGPHYRFNIGDPGSFEGKLEEAEMEYDLEEVQVTYETREYWGRELLGWLIPIGLMVLLWVFIMRRMSSGGAGGQLFNIGKSKATLFEKDTKVSVDFDDVAGLEEAKMEVMEVVDFLKNPNRYTELGGKIPKGVLLVGAPGTGKTLLAKAVAGEAAVPFFSLSGSDFVEMFVGVGASRVRDLFKQAKEKAPCIIFIDEIDAIGRSRGRNMVTGSNDERENTLNQLLTEMDGFSTNSGVILMAATNRPDVLDPALLRPGRFDRQISIDRPDVIGREQIFKVHLRPLKLKKDVDAKKLAAQTPGFAGAEIANVCNEAALIAARNGKKYVENDDFQSAIDRVIGGLEKKNKIISPEEKKIVAYHESGHAIVGWFLEHADPLLKVSIVPRGVAALGYAQYLPKDQYLFTKNQLMDTVSMALGGRVAEEITFGQISTGAQNDLERITKIAYDMVTIYGMDTKVGNLSFIDRTGEYNFKKPYSEKTAQLIDEEVRNFIEKAYERTRKLLLDKQHNLESLAQELLKKEIIFQSDLERILGESPHGRKSHYDIYYERSKKLQEKVEERKKQIFEKDGSSVEKKDEEKAQKSSENGQPSNKMKTKTSSSRSASKEKSRSSNKEDNKKNTSSTKGKSKQQKKSGE